MFRNGGFLTPGLRCHGGRNTHYTYIVKRYGEIFVRTKDLGAAIAVFNDKVTNLIGDLP